MRNSFHALDMKHEKLVMDSAGLIDEHVTLLMLSMILVHDSLVCTDDAVGCDER